MWWTALLFPVALGIFGIVFRIWAARSGYNYQLVMALFGGGMLGVAIMLYAYAMYVGCHGNFDPIKSVSACTYHDDKARGM